MRERTRNHGVHVAPRRAAERIRAGGGGGVHGAADLERVRRLGHAPGGYVLAGPVQRKVGFEFETSWEMAATEHDQGAPNTANEKKLPTKKQVLAEDGWQLHADFNRVPVAEFITDPVEEPDWLSLFGQLDALETKTGTYVAATGTAGRGGNWIRVLATGGGDAWLQQGDAEMKAAPQVTAGFRLDRIPEVMKALGARHEPGSKQLLAKPEGEGVENLARLVNTARAQASRFTRLLKAEPAVHEPLLGLRINEVPEEFEGVLSLLGMYALLGQKHAPLEYSKELSPLMARTNLGLLPAKVRNHSRLLEGVLYVAGTDDPNGKLFKSGFDKSGSVQFLGPTIKEWIDGIRKGDDPLRSFSGGDMSALGRLEGVTTKAVPKSSGGGFDYVSAAQGAIIELRGLQEGVPRTKWEDLAEHLREWIVAINDPSKAPKMYKPFSYT